MTEMIELADKIFEPLIQTRLMKHKNKQREKLKIKQMGLVELKKYSIWNEQVFGLT